MKNIMRYKSRITITAIVLIFLLTSPLKNSVIALYNTAHAVEVFLRFDAEILQKSPAGQYYRNLLMKHGEEQYQIVNDHPEHLDEFWKVVEMFVPGVEALVNGEGDTVRITREQMDRLRDEWEWESQFASPSFRGAVEMELKRLPLEKFVGMTMNEAWNFVKTKWASAPEIENSMPGCNLSPDSYCVKLAPVENPNGEFSYYIFNRIYFEVPNAWKVLDGGFANDYRFLLIIPSPDSLESQHLQYINIYGGDNIAKAKQELGMYMNGVAAWEQSISTPDFEGVEFITKGDIALLNVVLFNEEETLVAGIFTPIPLKTASLAEDIAMIKKIFPNLQRIIESIRIQDL